MNDTNSTQNQNEDLLGNIPDKSQPIVVLNLLKFREKAEYSAELNIECSGFDAYQTYLETAISVIESLGGRVVYSGTMIKLLAGEENTEWDEVILVEYPNTTALMNLSESEQYQQVFHHRTAGLEDTKVWITQNENP